MVRWAPVSLLKPAAKTRSVALLALHAGERGNGLVRRSAA
jgi:hypothetical protein